ncbi:ABC-2 family transporter protein [Rubripirellula amarantea]|uniref:ABC-2 family transporter protein n=1 Tax=Rubripirellula amarantea TaxID=2527999 RepID=A0A5C5WN94_9BACT|nr:ABC transporter permease [Rubripirellula amarantea]TWT51272.1 ABC-2 family transporter protein [Rubripirellula amarantea]
MVWTVFQVSLRRLMHNRIELMLTFVVPIAFFSIFALIFGNGIGGSTTPKIKVVAIDEVQTEISASVMATLQQSAGLRFMRMSDDSGDVPLDRQRAQAMVQEGSLTMAIVLHNGDRHAVAALDSDSAKNISADLLSDSSDQVASQVATALVARAIMMARAEAEAAEFDVFKSPVEVSQTVPASHIPDPPSSIIADQSGAIIADQSGVIIADPPGAIKQATHESSSPLSNPSSNPSSTQWESEISAGPYSSPADDPQSLKSPRAEDPVRVVDVIGEGKANPVVSMYAAGIAVMFLLFGASGGGGAFLEERENETLDRLLSTQLTMDHLLLGKWFYMTSLGTVQVFAMFMWAQFVFGVDLWGHLDGFIAMTIVTSAAASAFGLLLATLCKSRGQLNGLSVILILTMSALGGSMVPRYVMSERLRGFGQWTFNAWALDGYDKVFWRDLPIGSLAPQMIVLMICGIGFLSLARLLAVRWESN